jgi:hypothetical protein
MTNELKTYIEKLPIFSFILSNGLHILGRVLQSDSSMVIINAAVELETVYEEDGMIQRLIPMIPNSIEESSILYRNHIIIQTPAGFALKKQYCDSLLKLKVLKIINEPLSQSPNLETKEANQSNGDRWTF